MYLALFKEKQLPMEENSDFVKLLLIDESGNGSLSALEPDMKELFLNLEFFDVIEKLKKEKKEFAGKKVNQRSIEKILLHLAQ